MKRNKRPTYFISPCLIPTDLKRRTVFKYFPMWPSLFQSHCLSEVTHQTFMYLFSLWLKCFAIWVRLELYQIYIYIHIHILFSLPSKFLTKPLRVLEDEVNKTNKRTKGFSLWNKWTVLENLRIGTWIPGPGTSLSNIVLVILRKKKLHSLNACLSWKLHFIIG